MFCSKCGTNVPETDRFCPACGEPVNNSAPAGAAAPAPNYAPAPDASDHTAKFAPEDIAKTRYLSAICYLSPLFIVIALLLEQDSKFLRFHINQCILLSLLGFATIIPIVGLFVPIVVLVFTILGVLHAYKGTAKELPVIGKYTIVNYD